ncbi:PLAC8 family-domain-containing protein [Coprinopsis sp. MPI-PUGE-AT-0042]|nr:PLAC8 family-domain-containing protein [Coprinopsis sp. MPI-PUGE-AT-0042]
MSYEAKPQMTVAQGGGGNRNVNNVPVGPEGREWSNGLFSCCDTPGTFCTSYCCPCITYGRVRSRYKHLNDHGTVDPEMGGTFGPDCLTYCLTAFLGAACLFHMWNRGEIRQRYNVKGSCFKDFLTACCCAPCGLTQESRELELEEQSLV